MKQTGFSFIELMITIAIVGVLSGMGMAVYGQYQQRAFNSTALQVGLQLRTAFEAGLSEQSANSAIIFAENRTVEFAIDGTLSCASGCNDINLNSLFPGFSPQAGLKLIINFTTAQSYNISSGHCRALTADKDYYDGWIISDLDASIRAAFSVDPDEVSQCIAVMSGSPLS